jgi:hypothetical protein
LNAEYLRLIYVAICGVLIFIILSPTLVLFVDVPQGEKFSELYVLGQDRTFESIPSDISIGTEYKVIVGIGNHMRDVEYYSVRFKLRNQTDVSNDVQSGGPSSVDAVEDYRFFLANGGVREADFVFAFEDVSISGNVGRVSVLSINSRLFNVNKIANEGNEDKGFLYQMLFELWIFNTTTLNFQFHDRSSWFWVNVTSSNQ